jgi:transposase
MRVRNIDNIDFKLKELANELKECEFSDYLLRLFYVKMTLSGADLNVFNEFGVSPKTISYWTKRYLEMGLDALKTKDIPGRPGKLSNEELDALREAILKDPSFFGYEKANWDGKLLSEHILKELKISLSVRTCQRLFHVLGFSYTKPRMKPHKADEDKQKIFLK